MRLDGRDPAALAEAAQALADGELLAFPTETVYGLGARADDDRAVEAVFRTKGRPSGHPLIVHVADLAAAEAFSPRLTPLALRLAGACWPGPLTLIVERRPGVATAAAGGQDSIGLRCPNHPVALALLVEAHRRGVPGVAGPSANRFGRVSPTTAAHVEDEFGPTLRVLDGGACTVGIESTIVDARGERPVLLRPGLWTRAQVEALAGVALAERDDDAPRVSGSLASHYAPRATVRLMDGPMLRTALEVLGDAAAGLAVYSRSPLPAAGGALRWRRMPSQAAEVAQELFAVLRAFDAEGARLIWIEAPPSTPEWEGVRDRLQRAAAA